MFKRKSKFTRNWFDFILFGAISLLFLAIFIYLSGVKHAKESAAQFDDFFKEKLKEIVKVEVLNRLDEIEYGLNKIKTEENDLSAQKIQEIRRFLVNSPVIETEDLELKRKAAISLFEFLIQKDEERFYFIQDKTGNLIWSSNSDIYSGINYWDVADKDGIYFAREISKAAYFPKGIFVSYRWPKETNGEPLKKTSYCLYIPDFDFIIGTGVYEVDLIEKLKLRTYEQIQSYYEDKDNYVFILDYDGIIKVHANTNYVGRNVFKLNDAPIATAHTEIMKKLRRGNGFVTYDIDKKNTHIISEKITYVHKIDEWRVYIGMGFHTDDAVMEIEGYSEEFEKDHLTDTIVFIAILAVIAFISSFFIKNGLRIQKDILKQEDIVFEQLLELTNDGVVIVSNKGEILYKNNFIETMFKGKSEQVFSKNESENFIMIDYDIYRFNTELGREYFLKINIEKMIYQGSESKIYLIKNISDEYIRENELQKLAYYDVLTNLPNRRKLQNDFEDLFISITNSNEENTFVLAILDLDKFKIVNDTFGHEMGDNVLREFSEFISSKIRKSENLYRFGGEEFVMILKNVDLMRAKTILETINYRLNLNMEEKFGFPVTFSAGAVLVNFVDREANLDSYLKRADEFLYKAKENGRNKIEID